MHIMFWGCNCMGDITVCVNKMSMKTFYSVHTLICILIEAA